MALGPRACLECRVLAIFDRIVSYGTSCWHCPICKSRTKDHILPTAEIAKEFKDNLKFYKFVEGNDE